MPRAMSALVVFVLVTSACATSYAPLSTDPIDPVEPTGSIAPTAISSMGPIPNNRAAATTEKPNCFAELAIGAGKYEHETQGSNFDGDTDGGYLRFRTEYISHGGIGGGLAIEGAASDDDLFEDVGAPDSEGGFGDLYLYFVGVPVDTGRFRMPMRIGPYIHDTSIKDDTNNDEIDWGGIGVRGGVEPEFWLVQQDNFSFGFVGEVSLGVHATSIDVDSTVVNDDFDGNGVTFGADVGVQALIGERVTTRLAYVYRSTDEDESDSSNGLVVREMTASFSGIVLGVGVRF